MHTFPVFLATLFLLLPYLGCLVTLRHHDSESITRVYRQRGSNCFAIITVASTVGLHIVILIFARPIYYRYNAYMIHEGTVISKYLEQLNEMTGTVVHRSVANGSENPFRNNSLLLCYIYSFVF